VSDGPCCHRCRRPLLPGALKYAVRVAITADFDGHLEEVGGPGHGAGSEAEAQDALAQALAEAEALTEEELSAGVHQEWALLVCAACRQVLMRGLAAAGFLRDGGGMVQ